MTYTLGRNTSYATLAHVPAFCLSTCQFHSIMSLSSTLSARRIFYLMLMWGGTVTLWSPLRSPFSGESSAGSLG